MDYDVALSFAGEDRKYVEEVANELKKLGIRVFYDNFETVNLWGKNLYTHLQNVYQKQAKFTVIFISEHYAKKLWTNHERKMAQARAFTESKEYILPARFDDTEIEGIPSTTAFIDLRNYSPKEFCILINKKIELESYSQERDKTPSNSTLISDGNISGVNDISETMVNRFLLNGRWKVLFSLVTLICIIFILLKTVFKSQDTLEIVTAVVGIGGIAFASVIFIFREIIRKEIFPRLTRAQSYKLLNRIITLIFIIGVLGAIAYLILNLQNRNVSPINTEQMLSPTPYISPSAVPTPTPSLKSNVSNAKIKPRKSVITSKNTNKNLENSHEKPVVIYQKNSNN